MQVYLDKQDLADAQKYLSGIKSGFPKAFSRALNKTTVTVKTGMIAALRSKYNYKAAALRKRFKIHKATYANLYAYVRSTGVGVHLTDIATTRPTLKGVTVNVKKSTGRKLLAHAFIAPGTKSGKQIVFLRALEGGRMVGRLPVKAKYATDPELLYSSGTIWPTIQRDASATLDKNFKHEVDVVLKGIA